MNSIEQLLAMIDETYFTILDIKSALRNNPRNQSLESNLKWNQEYLYERVEKALEIKEKLEQRNVEILNQVSILNQIDEEEKVFTGVNMELYNLEQEFLNNKQIIERIESNQVELLIQCFNSECAICLEELKGFNMIHLPCGHCFHSRCLKVVGNRIKCPLCRKIANRIDIEYSKKFRFKLKK